MKMHPKYARLVIRSSGPHKDKNTDNNTHFLRLFLFPLRKVLSSPLRFVSFLSRKLFFLRPKFLKKAFLVVSCLAIVLLSFNHFLTPSQAFAAPWSPSHNQYGQRKQLTLVNNSGQTFESGTTYKITIDTQSLVNSGSVLTSCDDLRVVYQPSDTVATELKRNLEYSSTTTGVSTCATSSATKLVFQLQANIANSATDANYYLYFDNPRATTYPASDALAAYNVGSNTATLVAPFNGTTTALAAGSGTPTTATGAIRYSGGKSALSFDGTSSDLVNNGSNTSLDDIPLGDFTVEGWMNRAIQLENYPQIISKGWYVRLAGGSNPTLLDFIAPHSGGQARTWGGGPSSNTWTHWAVVWDSTSKSADIYINGTLNNGSKSAGSGTYTTDASTDLKIAGVQGMPPAYYRGMLDEIRISTVKRYTSNFTPQTTPFVRDEYTKLLLHFDENGDDPRNTGKAIDDSGNANHGTITGAKYVAGLVGVDGSTTANASTGYQSSQGYAGHEGVFIEEGTTNKITNPSFEHTTYNTNWNDATNLTETENTTAPYFKFGSKSAKLVASADDTFVISINAGNTNIHTLSAYAYDGTSGSVGGTVSSSVATLVFNGSTQTTTYTDMGGGWWRLTYSAAAGSGSQSYGVQVKSGKTVYVDGVQLEEKAYSTSYTDGTLGTGYAWTGTAHDSTSTRTNASIAYSGTSNFNTSAGSISLWWKAEINRASGDTNRTHSIFRSGDGGCKLELYHFTNYMTGGSTSNIQMQKHIGGACGSNKWASPAISVVNGAWYHIVGTWDTISGMKLYVNNSTPGTDSDTVAPSTNTLSIGSGSFLESDGSVSDLRIYSSVLTSTEIADLYYSSLGSHTALAPTATERFTDGQPPVLAWHINEGYGTTTYDSTIYQNTGTVSGASWFEDSEEAGIGGSKSLKFDGSNDYVSRAYNNDTELAPGTNPFSVSTWFKHPSTISGTDTIISRYNGAGYKLYMNSSGYICFAVDDDSTWSPDDSACTTTSYADSNWHHVLAVFRGSDPGQGLTLFLDGIQKASDTDISATGSKSGSSPTLYAGIDSDGSSNPWDGFIDEVRIYNSTRSEEQINQEYISRGTNKGVSAQFGAGGATDTLSQGLVGYWKMDEASWNGTSGEVLDASGNGNNGTRSGDATTATGKYGNGGTFDGTGDYIDLGDPDSLALTQSITLSTYIKPNTFVDGEVVYYGGAGDKFWIRLGSTGKVRVYLGGTSNPGYHVSVNSLSDGVWNLVAVTYNGSEARIFINGILDSVISTSGNRSDSGTQYSVKIGARFDGGGSEHFKGSLDDFRIYNRALSPAEVRALYDYAPGPVANWKFDEGSGQSALDSSGNGNTGTLGASSAVGSDDPTWTSGRYGKGLSFDGGDFTQTGFKIISDTNFCVSAWVKLNSISGYQNIFSQGPAYTTRSFLRVNGTGAVEADSGSGWWVTSSSNISANQWYYISYSYNSADNKKLYINGILVGTDSHGASISDDDRTRIGSDISGSNLIRGLIDDIRIYNYARTQKQIVQDMNAGHPAVGSPVGSPVAHYKFDEGQGTTANNSGSGGSTLNGTLTNMASPATSTSGWTNSGKFGKALSFDGSNDYVYASATGLPANNAIQTISVWSYYSATPSDTNLVVLENGGSAVQLGYRAGGLAAVWKSGGTNLVSTSLPGANTWHHYLYTYDGITHKFYVDGIYKSNSTTSPQTSSPSSLQIGRYTGGQYFNGSIDEIKIYNYALSEDEVKLEYNQGKTQVLGSLGTASDGKTVDNSASRAYCPPGNVEGNCAAGQNPAPVAEWNFDEGSGQVLNDISGNSNTGGFGSTGGVDSADPTWVSGKIGKALYLDVDDYAGNAANLTSVYNTFSFEIWAKPEETRLTATESTSGYGCLSNQRFASGPLNGGGNAGAGISIGTNGISVCEHGSGYLPALLVYDSSISGWNHIVVVYNNKQPSLYLNGVKVKTGLTSLQGNIYPSRFFGDAGVGAGYGPYKGYIDQVRIYDYARTPAQIAWDYNRGAPVIWYKMDECSGSTLHSTNEIYNASLNGTWSGTGGGTQTSVGDCGTSSTAWGNGATGKFIGSLNFDGTDDKFTINSTQNINMFNEFSFGGWIKTSYSGSEALTILNKGDFELSGTTSKYALSLSNTGHASAFYRNLSSNIGGTTNLRDGNWHHVISTISSSANSWKLYVDGKQVASTGVTAATSADTTGNLDIGTFIFYGSEASYMNGQLDDIRIYNYPLSDQQVKLLYNGGAAVSFK